MIAEKIANLPAHRPKVRAVVFSVVFLSIL
jgi:hypothetical protein